MGLKLDTNNIRGWICVAALQILALSLLAPASAMIHQKFFAVWLGEGLAWLVSIAYAIIETLGLAFIPMMYTAWKNKKHRFAFPLTLCCFLIILSFDVYMNNAMFSRRSAEHVKSTVEANVINKVDALESVVTLRKSFEIEERAFNLEETSRQKERNELRKNIAVFDSLSQENAKVGNNYSALLNSRRANELRDSKAKSEMESDRDRAKVEKARSAYFSEKNRQATAIQKAESDLANVKAEATALSDFFSHYPGLILLVTGLFVSGMTGFVIDRNKLMDYVKSDESRKAVVRKKWFAIVTDFLLVKMFGRTSEEKQQAQQNAETLRFSEDINVATLQLFELESSGQDRNLKLQGKHPRQVFAAKFGISEQAIYKRLKHQESRALEELANKPLNGKSHSLVKV